MAQADCRLIISESAAALPEPQTDLAGRRGPFARVDVDYLAQGGARVSWAIDPYYQGASPYSFQLQYSPSGLTGADDWINVGASTTGYTATDPRQRELGVAWAGHYRVVLTDPDGTWYSDPVSVRGIMSPYDWGLAREIVRRHRLLANLAGVKGWLLKRRRIGTPAAAAPRADAVVDSLTGGVIRRRNTVTQGAEVLPDGYYPPVPFEVMPTTGGSFERLDGPRATTDPAAWSQRATFVCCPPVAVRDVFVADGSDRRYYVGSDLRHEAEWRGVPLLASASFRLAEPNDPIYRLAVPASRQEPAG